MLKINPKVIKKINMYLLIRKIKKSKNKRLSRFKYGKAFMLDVKKTGIILDLVIPATFGLITLGLIKKFGNKELLRFKWDWETFKAKIKAKTIERRLYTL